jgi:hypothetical protein
MVSNKVKERMLIDPEYKAQILEKRRIYAQKYRAKKKDTSKVKLCSKCNEKPVLMKYCDGCRREVRLERNRHLWATDPVYRERHKKIALKSFHKRKNNNERTETIPSNNECFGGLPEIA